MSKDESRVPKIVHQEVTREEIDNWIAGATVEYLEQSYEKKIKQALLRLLDDADLEIRDYAYGGEERE